ncbi:SusC/RagA family TonB-linked outer membrane protein [Butyricimonas sp. Marseille-P3923]|uniref:SusC/RagA family TonB-linked outer membrane protein n=1 Tax=Butyricimonas sp. Marseille-P3923 TaxID=1987504 RepID=UPI000C06816B|nr:SusC/RagA family TonB-linked outer membrane protein [Butyricimonas sp. Marseille-P3923]
MKKNRNSCHLKRQVLQKSCRIMQLTLIMIVGLILTSFTKVIAQERGIDFKADSIPAEMVINQLKDLTHYRFLYNHEEIRQLPAKKINLKNVTIKQILDVFLEGSKLAYTIEDNVIIISPKLKNSQAKTTNEKKKITLSGRITDSENIALPGATVVVKGQNLGVATDIDGNFTLELTQGEKITLIISFVGMKSQQVSYDCMQDNRSIHIILEEDNTEIDEIVVTGIFKKAKESYTGAVTSVNKEQLDMYRGQNLLQTLKNIDASLNFSIDNLNGSNPNSIPSLNIRGNASLPMNVAEFNESNKNNPNTPLIIMDGFEISLTKLMDYNDEEIESINILKDAAATAIYGSRGANGVIVVISKKPEPGKLKISAEMGFSLEIPDLTSYDLLNANEKLEVEQLAGLYKVPATNYGDYATQEQLYNQAYNRRLKDVLSGIDTDWLSKPLHTGVGAKYNLRLEGGSEQLRWATSLSYNNTQGAMKGSSRRTFNGSITLMYEMKNLIFRNYTSIGINRSHESNYGVFSTYAAQQPYNAPYNENGKLVRYFAPFCEGVTNDRQQNPLYDATLNTFDKNGYQELTNNFSIDWKIIQDMTLRGQLGISNTQNTSDYFLPSEHSYFTTGAGRDEYSTDEGFLRRGLYRYGNGKLFSYNMNITLSYNKIINDVHSLYTGLDWSMQQSKSDNFSIALEGFSNEDLNSIGDARQYAKNELPSGSTSLSRQFGVTANINYTYDNRYYIDFSYRIDGNSTYGSNKKYAPFYSLGLGWNLHREKFLQNIPIINTLRLKASYGETGSTTGATMTDAYTMYQYITDNKYANWTGAQLTGWGNPNLTWQTTNQLNFGLEFGLWENRVKGSLDVYTKNTSNLLSSINIPSSMGFTSYNANIGEVKNNGFEATLSTYIIRNREQDFNWIITGQLIYNKNKISKLSEAIKAQTEAYMKQDEDGEGNAINDVQKLFYEGDPQNAIYAVRSLGIDPSTGKEIFLDKDGNICREWKASNKVCLGAAEPLYRGNASTMLQWKDFTLNVSFYYYWGGKTYNQTLRDKVEVTTNSLINSNADSRVLKNRWYEVGDIAFFKKLSNNETRSTSRYVMDDNVFEIQSVSLQYKWKNEKLKKWTNLNTVIFGVNISNLFHFSSIKMERGTNYPFARNIQGSIKLLF